MSIHYLYSAKLWTYDRTIVALGMPCGGGGVRGLEQVSSVSCSRLWVAVGLKGFADTLLRRFFALLETAHFAHQSRQDLQYYCIVRIHL